MIIEILTNILCKHYFLCNNFLDLNYTMFYYFNTVNKLLKCYIKLEFVTIYIINAAFIYIFLCCGVLSESFWARLGVLIDIIELRLQADKMHIY